MYQHSLLVLWGLLCNRQWVGQNAAQASCRVMPALLFIHLPAQSPSPPQWQPSQHRWPGCEWVCAQTLQQMLLLSRCPSASRRDYSRLYPVPHSYFWVFNDFSSASWILISSHVWSFPSLLPCLEALEERSVAVIPLRFGCRYVYTCALFPFVCSHFLSLLGLATYIE